MKRGRVLIVGVLAFLGLFLSGEASAMDRRVWKAPLWDSDDGVLTPTESGDGITVSGITNTQEPVFISTAGKPGIVFGSLGTATRAIDLESSGLSGSGDYWAFFDASNYWNAAGDVRISELQINSNIRSSSVSVDLKINASITSSILLGNSSSADTFTNGSTTGTTRYTHADISDGNVAVGDFFHVTDSSTAADEGVYHVVDVSEAASDILYVSRNFAGTQSDVDVVVHKGVIAFHATDGVLGQQITQHSRQDEPLCIGGEVGECGASDHGLGSTGVIFPPTAKVEFDAVIYLDDIAIIDDDKYIRFGNSNASSARIVWQISDPNAEGLFVILPDGDSMDVAVLVVGDQGIIGNNLGWFDGITDPSIALVSSDEQYRSRIFTSTDNVFNIVVGGQTGFQVNSDGSILGGVSAYKVYSGNTIPPSALGGGIVDYDSSTIGGVTLPYLSGGTAFVTIVDMLGSGVTVFTERRDANNGGLFNRPNWGNRIWTAPGSVGNMVILREYTSGVSPSVWHAIRTVGTWTVVD